ncbi:MAG: hypothetical protein J6N77_03930 [Lachnospiraceae bacterium]|nr:hypothetical protein [Lachnospiraceae bacterium]
MIGLRIADIRDFTSRLFVKDTFDSFELAEAEFVTRYTTTLDGTLTEPQEDHLHATWGQVRPVAYAVIRGKELPHSFRLVLRLSDENVKKTLASLGLSISPEEVGALFLNILYNHEQLTVVTGCSLKTFSLDKTLEKEWDRLARRFFAKNQIPVEEV